MSTSEMITFLFTDIEGSTPRWDQHPEEMRRALAQHNLIMHQVMAAQEGHVFKIVGDEFQVAFTNPVQAVNAAVEAQRQLSSADWPEVVSPLKVRMGIHTGEAEKDTSGDFAATHTLNRVARISSAGHGGQILISLVSAELARERLKEPVFFHDLGEHYLKGLANPEHIFQVQTGGLEGDFPALKTISLSSHNLPQMRTTFIGREKEITQLYSLVNSSRLVTLTGIGGVGKTRLTVQTAHLLLEDFPEGLFWVELAPVTNPERIVDAIAESLSVREQADRMLIETIESELCEHKKLLVLDNCEHHIEASANLVDRLLRRCPELHILTTSREPLQVEGEVTMHVPPLPTPSEDNIGPDGIARSEAVELFSERARAVLPEFELSAENSRAVSQICQRLDGIPLAIELAAARVPVMPVVQIAARLDHVFQLLSGSSRTRAPRHQTLQATIDWSCQMLTQEEQLFFTRLSVFAGGWTLEAAESICSDEQINKTFALELLTRLVNKSLVILDRRPGRLGRYRFLEPIRQYARDMLEEIGQTDPLAAKHLAYYLDFAESNTAQLSGEDQIDALEQIEIESDNLRAALAWSLAKPEKTHENLHLAIALGNFWLVRGHLQEGREWLAKILADENTLSYPANRAQVLHLVAMMAYRQSDYPAAQAAWEESLQISRTLGEEGLSGIHPALTGLAMVASELGDYQTAPQLLQEALEITRQIGDELNEADILRNLGWAAMRPGDYRQAREYLEQAAALFRKLNEKVGLSSSYSGLGEVALRQGELTHARTHLEEALKLRRELENKWGIGATLGTLGWVALTAGDYQRAKQFLGESLTVRQELGDKGGIAWCLEKLAQTAQTQQDYPQSARLYGAASAIRESLDSIIDPADQPAYEEEIASLKANLPEEDFQILWHEGAAMEMEQVVKTTLAGMPA